MHNKNLNGDRSARFHDVTSILGILLTERTKLKKHLFNERCYVVALCKIKILKA